MSERQRFSAEQLCSMYPDKYIAIKHISKGKDNVIIGAEILKIYDTIDECKRQLEEIKFYMKLYKDDFDIIYGDYDDYLRTRANCRVIEIPMEDFTTVDEDGVVVIDAFKALGGIAFELFSGVVQ